MGRITIRLVTRMLGDFTSKLYTKQIQALNQLVLKAVSGIIERSSQPPIIVIQGDHGPASRWDWDDQKNSDVNERTGILNALLLPGVDTSALDSELSAVNQFSSNL